MTGFRWGGGGAAGRRLRPLDAQVAVVTEGSRGIGRAAALPPQGLDRTVRGRRA